MDSYVPAGIGDLNSDAKGSGARFNTGKPDLSLIPLIMMADQILGDDANNTAGKLLALLAGFQSTQDAFFLREMLDAMGDEGWAECAHVFAYGKKKYAAWNWAKGMPWSVPLACAARHLKAMVDDFDSVDDESQRKHVGHVMCNVVMLLQYTKTYPEGNDLPPKGLL